MSSRDKAKSKRSKSRSRSRDRTRERKGTIIFILNLIEKTSRWSDAPSSSSSRFSSGPVSVKTEDKTSQSQNYPTKPTAVYGTGSNVNPNIMYTLNDNSKIKRKIFIPKVQGVNFVGLLIGPKGTYQKRLEQQSGCKILIRGKYVN